MMIRDTIIKLDTLRLVHERLTAQARGLTGRKQDSGVRFAIETVEEIMEELKNGDKK